MRIKLLINDIEVYNKEITTSKSRKVLASRIVRRIDDLGRVVIPRDIRCALAINENDCIELVLQNDGSVILRKYSPIEES